MVKKYYDISPIIIGKRLVNNDPKVLINNYSKSLLSVFLLDTVFHTLYS